MTATIAGRSRAGSPLAVRQYAELSAAVLMAVAAGIHVAVVGEHLHEWPLAGAFFIALAAWQALLAFLLVRRPGPLTLLASIWSTVGVVGVYVWSRTTDLPFAPADHAGHGAGSQAGHAVGGHGNGVPLYPGASSTAEPVGALDLAALGAELAMIAVLVYLLPMRHRGWTSNGILLCGVGMVALRMTGVLS